MCLAPLSDILNRTGKGFHISGSSPVVSHLVYMDDLKLRYMATRKLKLSHQFTHLIFILMIFVWTLEQQSVVLWLL